jgi:hypothetical protein
MHTVDLLEQAVAMAESVGYAVRQEWLGGAGGGSCEIRGRKWLFVDLALTPAEQLSQVLEVLRSTNELAHVTNEPEQATLAGESTTVDDCVTLPISRELRRALGFRKSA